MPKLNLVQELALTLIQSDAKWLYTLIKMNKLGNNYMSMSIPYMGLFVHGSEMWGKKMGLNSPKFTEQERKFHTETRLAHKLWSLKYTNLKEVLYQKYLEHDKYFYDTRTLRSKLTGKYFNVGCDIFDGFYCGNTILLSMYSSDISLEHRDGEFIKEVNVISGKLLSYYCSYDLVPYEFSTDFLSSYKDIHLFKDTLFKENSFESFCYFSILCAINYVIVFTEKVFLDEIPQKLKFAYLLYFYLVDLIDEIFEEDNVRFHMDTKLYSSELRNCFSHYGLGQFMNAGDIKANDLLGGLTDKALRLNYDDTKQFLYGQLQGLVEQIEDKIF